MLYANGGTGAVSAPAIDVQIDRLERCKGLNGTPRYRRSGQPRGGLEERYEQATETIEGCRKVEQEAIRSTGTAGE
jgi:hypothetical protein